MSITIHLEALAEAALRAQAERAGLSLEEFARQLLERESEISSRYHPKVEASLRIVEKLRGKLGPVPDLALAPKLLYGEA